MGIFHYKSSSELGVPPFLQSPKYQFDVVKTITNWLRVFILFMVVWGMVYYYCYCYYYQYYYYYCYSYFDHISLTTVTKVYLKNMITFV